jgi:hypothetical protein
MTTTIADRSRPSCSCLRCTEPAAARRMHGAGLGLPDSCSTISPEGVARTRGRVDYGLVPSVCGFCLPRARH